MSHKKYYLPLLFDTRYSIYPIGRIGGFGLGNLLFPYFRALCNAVKDSANLLYPHFNQFQPRNFIREMKGSALRNYSSDFEKLGWSSIPKFNSFSIYLRKNWSSEEYLSSSSNIVFCGYRNHFYDLINYRDQIRKYINVTYQSKFKISNDVVAFHIRLGDFKLINQSIKKEDILGMINYFTKEMNLKVNIYSDSRRKSLLSYLNLEELPENVFFTKSLTPMTDIIQMSKFKFICGTPFSSFVEWSRFLAEDNLKQKSYSMLDKKHFEKIKMTPLNWDYYN